MLQKYLIILAVFISTVMALPRTVTGSSGGLDNQVTDKAAVIDNAFSLLKARNDDAALEAFDQILSTEPANIDALWGKAEILRRRRSWIESEAILKQILVVRPDHVPSLITLSYIRYHDDRLSEARQLVDKALDTPGISKENLSLAYIMLGTINSRRCAKGRFLSKLQYGTQVKNYFLKAKELAPDLAEVHLGLGTFYLKALDKAIAELELAVKLAPDFATAQARLGQAYKKKGELGKCKFCLLRAQDLDPENEALLE
jgi:tetratricopeptide (TPR) repeat protein